MIFVTPNAYVHMLQSDKYQNICVWADLGLHDGLISRWGESRSSSYVLVLDGDRIFFHISIVRKIAINCDFNDL